MARTPLLRSLVQLAAEHREAERLGLPPAEYRDRVAEARSGGSDPAEWPAGLTRRRFLAGAAAAGVAAGLATVGRAPRPVRAGGPRIAIVGGGISGLSAALTLADRGLASTVYEAADRIGGRMHSDARGFWADGQVSEWCGEMIDTGHKTILHLAQRYGLATADLPSAELTGSDETYKFFGAYYPKDQADSDFQPVHQALQNDVQAASYPTTYKVNTPGGVALDEMTVYDWIDSRVPGGHASPFGQLLDVAYDIEYGAQAKDQSALNLVYLLGYKASPGNFSIFGASDERYHIVGGNQRLPATIGADIAGRGVTIQTGWRMTALAHRSDGTYSISFDGRSAVVADRVVLALPFAVLRTLNTKNAGFDALKTTAIQDLGRGRNGKLQLQFGTRFWNATGAWPGISNGETYSDTGYQNTWEVSRAQTGLSGILVDYTGGDVAGSFKPSNPYSDTSTSAQVTSYATAFLRQLEPVLPGATRAWNGRATLSIPALDPNLNLSYSYWRVGQYVAFSGYEGVRQANCHFAGEHCSQDFQGFMEGGASEGIRAAGEILADLK